MHEKEFLATLKMYLMELNRIYLCNYKNMCRTQRTYRKNVSPLLMKQHELRPTSNIGCITETSNACDIEHFNEKCRRQSSVGNNGHFIMKLGDIRGYKTIKHTLHCTSLAQIRRGIRSRTDPEYDKN